MFILIKVNMDNLCNLMRDWNWIEFMLFQFLSPLLVFCKTMHKPLRNELMIEETQSLNLNYALRFGK